MNDPNKKIDVNLSSLMSLKAELLRKQAEVSKVKATRSTEQITPSRTKIYRKDPVPEPTSKKDEKNSSKVYEIEDSELLEKSKKVLEAKSKYYDRMAAMGGKLNSDDNCLVLFNRKKQEDQKCYPSEKRYSSSSDNSDSEKEQDEEPIHPDDEWVEYTDCLGRTRKCMRGDLELIKKKDTELAASMPERLDQSRPNWMIDVVGKEPTVESRAPASVIGEDGVSVISKHDEMRNNWEKKEIENFTKENVHYQDVFFDEARQHGVGYYAFSTDEEERARQQKELEETRKKTLNEQANKEAQRIQREKIIAERVKAAKNRQRARLGLPPLEDEEINEDKAPKETKEERKKRKQAEKQKRRQEKEEQIREEERQNHVRPWDKEKTGVRSETVGEDNSEQPWAYRPERNPMSQEQWNEKKRAERNPEFAPRPEEQPRRKNKHSDSLDQETVSSHTKISRTSFRSENSTLSMPPPHNPFASVGNDSLDLDSFAPFQSTKRNKTFQKKNSNALADADYEEPFESRRGAEIPPPKDLNPEPYVKSTKTRESLENSIEAGLKFLRNNFDKGTGSNKSSWTARMDY